MEENKVADMKTLFQCFLRNSGLLYLAKRLMFCDRIKKKKIKDETENLSLEKLCFYAYLDINELGIFSKLFFWDFEAIFQE